MVKDAVDDNVLVNNVLSDSFRISLPAVNHEKDFVGVNAEKVDLVKAVNCV